MTLPGRHSERATRALRRLGEFDPAVAALAIWCRHFDADGPLPAWTDGTTINYGSAFETLPAHEQMGLAAHQVLHVTFRHAPRSAALWRRFGDRFDEDVFNIASDALVNQTLLLAGYALPRPCVTLVDLLRESFGETIEPEAAMSRYDSEALYVRLMHGNGARGKPSRGDGDAGASIADKARAYAERLGFARDLEAARADPEAARREAVEEIEWRQRVAQALETGRRAGTGVGALGWRLRDVPQARTPWETLLRGLVSKAVTEGPRLSHQRPSRRWLALEDAARRHGAPEPAFEPAMLRQLAAARIAVAVDSSGSVDDGLLALFAAQVAGIGRRAGAEVHVLVFDEVVRSHRCMRGADWEREITEIRFARDGGTSFVDVMAAAAALDPAAIVVLTDLDGPFGPQPGRTPVFWVTPDESPRREPPYGRVLSLNR